MCLNLCTIAFDIGLSTVHMCTIFGTIWRETKKFRFNNCSNNMETLIIKRYCSTYHSEQCEIDNDKIVDCGTFNRA